MAKASSDLAAQLAERLNYLPIAVFGLWLASVVQLWFQLAGPMLPFGWQPPGLPPLPWFAGAVFAGMAVLRLPAGWYRVAGFEPRLYRGLGVLVFRRFVTNGDSWVRAVRRRYPGYTVHRGDFAKALASSRVSERAHLGWLLFGAVTSAYALAIGWNGWAAWTIVTNVIANLYPSLLQRYTRARLARLGIV